MRAKIIMPCLNRVTLLVYDDSIVVQRKKIFGGVDEKKIYINHISDIEIKRPKNMSQMSRGTMQITTTGETSFLFPETMVVFMPLQLDTALKIQQFVSDATNTSDTSSSTISELTKLKELLDSDAITQDEYEKLKDKLVNSI